MGKTDTSAEIKTTQAAQVEAISTYIAHGSETSCEACIGLELEHFIVRKNSLAYVPYFDDPITDCQGVSHVLKRLAAYYDKKIFETQAEGTQNLIGLSRKSVAITLEPGAQLEISIGPVLEISELELLYQGFRHELDPILEELELDIIELGYHPSICAAAIPLIPKNRYKFMDEHFKQTGKLGICMMRATASTQVSIDFSSEQDAVRKFRIANLLTPLLAFITDNSPVFELAALGEPPAPRRMVRTSIWSDVDAHRAMTAPKTFDTNFGFAVYAQALLEAPAIFTLATNSFGELKSAQATDRSLAQVFNKTPLDRATVEHILSLFFYDVRFKTYIEIRAADSLPIRYALAFATLVKSLFYNDTSLTYLTERFVGLGAQDIAYAKLALQQDGYSAKVYGQKANILLEELFLLAHNSLSPLESSYLLPLEELLALRKTPVDMVQLKTVP